MALHRYSLICRSARPNPDTQNLDLIDVIDEIHVDGVTQATGATSAVGLRLGLHMVSVWHRDDWDVAEELEMRLVYVGPDKRELGSTGRLPVNLREYRVVRITANLETLPFRGFGVYRIRIEKRSPPSTAWEDAGGAITVGIWAAPATPSANIAPA
jgi:hypothetical protein